METKEILEKAIYEYGPDKQIIVAIEEMSELQKELCKYFRYGTDLQRVKNIAEEIADVSIMLEQLKIIFQCGHEVDAQQEKKLLRLADNIGIKRRPWL